MEIFSKNNDIDNILKTDEAKINYLTGLARVALSDGSTRSSEVDYFDDIATNIGLPPAAVESVENLWDSYGVASIHFETRTEKIYFLMQALFLAWADKDLSDSELSEIHNMATELSIDDDTLKKIEDWVSTGVNWMNKGSDLLQ